MDVVAASRSLRSLAASYEHAARTIAASGPVDVRALDGAVASARTALGDDAWRLLPDRVLDAIDPATPQLLDAPGAAMSAALDARTGAALLDHGLAATGAAAGEAAIRSAALAASIESLDLGRAAARTVDARSTTWNDVLPMRTELALRTEAVSNLLPGIDGGPAGPLGEAGAVARASLPPVDEAVVAPIGARAVEPPRLGTRVALLRAASSALGAAQLARFGDRRGSRLVELATDAATHAAATERERALSVVRRVPAALDATDHAQVSRLSAAVGEVANLVDGAGEPTALHRATIVRAADAVQAQLLTLAAHPAIGRDRADTLVIAGATAAVLAGGTVSAGGRAAVDLRAAATLLDEAGTDVARRATAWKALDRDIAMLSTMRPGMRNAPPPRTADAAVALHDALEQLARVREVTASATALEPEAGAHAAARLEPASLAWHAEARALAQSPHLADAFGLTDRDLAGTPAQLRATIADTSGKLDRLAALHARVAAGSTDATERMRDLRHRAAEVFATNAAAASAAEGTPRHASAAAADLARWWNDLPAGAERSALASDLRPDVYLADAATGLRTGFVTAPPTPGDATIDLLVRTLGPLARRAGANPPTLQEFSTAAGEIRLAALDAAPADRPAIDRALHQLDARMVPMSEAVGGSEHAFATSGARTLLDRAHTSLGEGEAWGTWTGFDVWGITIPLRVPSGVAISTAHFDRATEALQLARDQAVATGASDTVDLLDTALAHAAESRAGLIRYRDIAEAGKITYPGDNAIDGVSALERRIAAAVANPLALDAAGRVELGTAIDDYGRAVHEKFGADYGYSTATMLDRGERSRVYPIWDGHADWSRIGRARLDLEVARDWADFNLANPSHATL